MEDLVLVRRIPKAELAKMSSQLGRPIRESFCLRKYSKTILVVVPPGHFNEGDKVDFYLSTSGSGFAIRVYPGGSRALSGTKGSRTASVPFDMREKFDGLQDGSYELHSELREPGLWFFDFAQIESCK